MAVSACSIPFAASLPSLPDLGLLATTPLRAHLVGPAALAGLLTGMTITATARLSAALSRSRSRRGLFVRPRARRPCPRCGGFGLRRCGLCSGNGVVLAGYPRELMPCPVCLQRRAVRCGMCAGSGARPGATTGWERAARRAKEGVVTAFGVAVARALARGPGRRAAAARPAG